MKFQFDPNQQYQLDAISAVTDLFKGQKATTEHFGIDKGKISSLKDPSSFHAGYLAGYGNKLTLTDEQLYNNLKAVQEKNALLFTSPSDQKPPQSPLSGGSETEDYQGKNFTVEMETGTGKTYTYLRTIFELNKQYRFNKFIIVVPSIAIREGVLKSLDIMKSHFKMLYSGLQFKEFIYQSKKTTILRDFATNNNLQIMIINIDAFNKDKNIIHSPRDQMGGTKPIQFIQATHPIVIMDEPQNMESEKSHTAIKSLNPLFTLRYSATHRNLYNLVYRLNPVQAFQKKLVKKISVASVVQENDPTKSYIKVMKITNKKNKITCTLKFFKNTIDGPKLIQKVCKQHDDLFIHSKENPLYNNGFKIINISCKPTQEFVCFANGVKLRLGEEQGGSKEEVVKIQIKETIKAHFEKENQLKGQGIKVLTLFFLDRVANYRIYKEGTSSLGPYGKWFEEIYKEILNEYKETQGETARSARIQGATGEMSPTSKVDVKHKISNKMNIIPADKVHGGYFSKDNKGTIKDTKGNTKEDQNTYNLIMKDKEKLLDINNPLKFIFSHSALREGWDNPNIFQICTLNETSSTIKKRQEIGRGLRLPVNQQGKRVQDDLINNLVVVANESYSDFVQSLQKEMEEDLNIVFGALPIDVFKGLVLKKEGKEYTMSLEDSKKIWNDLKSKGYLSKEGMITPEFSKALQHNTFSIPKEFQNIIQDIITTVEKHQMDRYIQKHKTKRKAGLNKKTLLDPEFKKFWDKISQKTFYSVEYSTEELTQKAGKAIQKMPHISPVKITVDRADIKVEQKGVEAVLTQTPTQYALPKRKEIPDILSYIEEKIRITKRTIFNILKKANRWDDFLKNPQQFMDMAVEEIRNVLQNLIIDGIKYEKLTPPGPPYQGGMEKPTHQGGDHHPRVNQSSYEMSRFYEEEQKMEFVDDKIIPTQKSVYDYIYYESTPEKQFATALESMQNIKYFIKLPSWFKVPTPVGDYNPDWAILKQNGDVVYMIRETKAKLKEGALRGIEKHKVSCGQKHFESIGVDYKVCTADIKTADL